MSNWRTARRTSVSGSREKEKAGNDRQSSSASGVSVITLNVLSFPYTPQRFAVRECESEGVEQSESGILFRKRNPHRSELWGNRRSEFGATPSPAPCGDGSRQRCHCTLTGRDRHRQGTNRAHHSRTQPA